MNPAAAFPQIPDTVDLLPGTPLADLWDRFEVFEALHHSTQICSPLTTEHLDQVVTGLAPRDRDRMLDLACGYGELLLRCVEHAAIEGIGIDLSPWMLVGATGQTSRRAPDAKLHWVLGEARNYVIDRQFDIVTCLGAEWIWHGFNGTVRAIATRTRVGGRAAVGAARLSHGADAADVAARHGHVETVDEMENTLAKYGLELIDRIDPDDANWDDYLERTATAARTWAVDHPGPRAERWLADQQDWKEARERDREIIGWSVWVVRRLP